MFELIIQYNSNYKHRIIPHFSSKLEDMLRKRIYSGKCSIENDLQTITLSFMYESQTGAKIGKILVEKLIKYEKVDPQEIKLKINGCNPRDI